MVGYGRIIPQWMIDLPPLGNINLHASLLPKYRGAAPIQWAIATGETVTGVTTMRIDAGLDTGDILLQAEERIAPEDTALTLAPRLAQTGAELMITTLAGLKNGTITPRPQDDDAGHARADSQARRWPDRFLAQRGGSVEPSARISAVARGFHLLSRQDAASPCGDTGVRRCRCRAGPFRRLRRSSAAGLRARHRAGSAGASARRQEADERAGFHQRLSAAQRRGPGHTAELTMPVSPARAAAFDILLRVDQQDAYASELLHSSGSTTSAPPIALWPRNS